MAPALPTDERAKDIKKEKKKTVALRLCVSEIRTRLELASARSARQSFFFLSFIL